MNKENEASRIDLVALWLLLWRYKFLIGSIALACGALAAITALLMTPLFRAEVVVTAAREGPMNGASSLISQFGGLASLAGVNLASGGNSTLEAQAVLESRRLVEEFIRREKLAPVLLENSKKPPTVWLAVEYFEDHVLQIRTDKLSGRTTVTIEWKDPQVAARWANGFVALANELMRTRALSEAQRNIAFLNAQIVKTNVLDVQKVMYGLIETETKTLMLASGRMEYAFTVVDPAVPPEQRTSPKRTIMVLIGLVLGTVLGTGIAFLRDMRRKGVRIGTPEL